MPDLTTRFIKPMVMEHKGHYKKSETKFFRYDCNLDCLSMHAHTLVIAYSILYDSERLNLLMMGHYQIIIIMSVVTIKVIMAIREENASVIGNSIFRYKFTT